MREGICRACKEWTTVEESCCGAPVFVEGSWEMPEEDDGHQDQPDDCL
jgi:hypothetical protein